MPVGGFLDSFPTLLFVIAHVLFLGVGLWAVRRGTMFWLYVVSQVGFLASFGGVLTLKMAVLLEQVLILTLIVMLVRRPPAT